MMANPVSPFTAATPVAITLKPGERLVLRVDNTSGCEVLCNVNKGVAANAASHYLTANDGVEIKIKDGGVVNVFSKTGTPSIYYIVEQPEYEV